MSSFTLDDTIVAIATPVGVGGIGIIRLSGPKALKIAKACCPEQVEWTPRMAYLNTIRHPKTREVLDEGCVLYFKGPASYTGEDTVEFQVHSGPQLLRSIIQACESDGARLAEKGEFTRRAFMHGKMDLTKAEAVMDLMEATNPTAQKVAISHLEGRLLSHIRTIQKSLMMILEQVEGSIDFPEEVPTIDHRMVSQELEKIDSQLSSVLAREDYGEAVRTGVQVVIIGQPNVGKSSLMNQLIGHERSIVTPIPGTTRDYIEGKFNYGGLTFHVYDTAGLRQSTDDVIEQLGMQKIQGLIQKAHVILWVVDGSRSLSEQDQYIYETVKMHLNVCCLINKSDKPRQINTHKLPQQVAQIASHAKGPDGLDELKKYLDSEIISRIKDIDLEWLCNIRQQAVLTELYTHIQSLQKTLATGFEDDMLATDLKKAVTACHELTGEEITELVLDGVFSRFCVGK